MIPNYFVLLEKMPLTPNGKIDRKALPKPDLNDTGVQYVAPQNEIEEKLVEIWSEILKKDGIGINHNFFNLGGHSLKAASLVAKIHKELNVEVPLKEVFTNPTIKRLADYIKDAERTDFSSIQPVEETKYYLVSSAQKRLYILDQMEEISTGYNIPRAIMVKGALDRERLEQSINDLIKRHETLRTSFETIEGEIVQIVHKEVNLKVTSIEAANGDITEILKQFVQPFDLKKAPLLRVGLVELAKEEHILLLDVHHIISDGTSMSLILQELVKLYEDKEIPVLPIQYKDFSAWQNDLFKTGVIEKQEKYWLDTLAGDIPVLNLPTDYPRPSVQSFKGDKVTFELNAELCERLTELAVNMDSTLYMVLLSAYNVLLYKYTGQEDIIIGSPIAGRRHVDLENIIGMFVNMLVMRNAPSGNKIFIEFLTEIRENTLEAYDNQDYQFEELVEKLNLKRDLSRNPLFDVAFTLHNSSNAAIETSSLSFTPYGLENNISKFDISLDVVEGNDRIVLSFEYCTDLFKMETMNRLSTHYVNILRQITDKPEVRLAKIEILSDMERKQLLDEFNDTTMGYNKEKTLHELFIEQVDRTPDNIALVFENEKLSYGELNTKTNQLAHLLREYGVAREEVIGIMAERSIEMIIGILAVLKAGGAYLPINPDYPKERKIICLKIVKSEYYLPTMIMQKILNMMD